jgi:integrase
MPRPRNPVPTYRLHRQSGQAVITLRLPDGSRKDVLLGPYGSDASKAEYERVLAEWRAAGGRAAGRAAAPTGLTVNELILAYWRHAEQHYRHPDGSPTSELDCLRAALRPFRALYGHTPAAAFGPLALKAVRERMVTSGWCRNLVNKHVGRVKRVIRWAVSEELLPPSAYHALQAVAGLARGRTAARETEPVKPVPAAFVNAVLPLVLPPVRAMIELQRLTGMRPGEVCAMRPRDLDTSGAVWLYRPPRHKTAWRGRERIVALGPRAQAVVRRFLTLDTSAHLFSPRRALAERAERMRAARKRRVQPSQRDRRRRAPKRPPRDHYDAVSYQTAIRRACRKAGVPAWGSNRLRHNHGTEVRRRFGLEAAQVALGHAAADVTQVYAERDLALAERVAAEIG